MLARIAPYLFVVLWSSGFIGARFGLPFAEPATFLLLRMLANLVVFAVLLKLLKVSLPKGKMLWHSMMVGVLIHGFYLGGTYKAISLGMPAGLCSLLVGLQPILTAVLLVMFSRESLRLTQWLGLALGFVGIGLVLQGNMSWQQEGARAWAYAFTVLALLGITLGTLYQKRFCQGVDLIGGTFWQYTATAGLLAVVAVSTETMVVDWNSQFVFTLAWLVFVLSLVAILLLLYMVKHGESAKVASVFYLVPPMTAFQAWLAFGEQFDAFGVIGFVMAAMAVYLMMRPAPKAKVICNTVSEN
ncbi:multidrug transporter [Photobacterium jeanii]|uniref:Multidrug transporter n=1 Tax=Photobacterium jeanii TaxID=858640 RepID=A0A178KAS2_9GAMM|nr:DMT family transporter [Photobacterium jeanii]OAN13814.1 multidrug transporter [Photobacterium jeanii]PST92724.1 EamA/RhaT family transporter [Photobacterium jeanii]